MDQYLKGFGPFFGADLDRDDCDVLAIQHIPKKLRAGELDLIGKRWFDYRRMHPVMATFLFTHIYRQAYGRAVAESINFERGRFSTGMKSPNWLDSREKLSFWRLRQVIDLHGIRYDFFLRKAMTWAIEAGWPRLPRPCHICTNPDMVVWIVERWQEECAGRIQYPQHEYFRTENFVGAADQLASEAWVLDQISVRAQRKYGIHAAVYEAGVVRIEAALARFGFEAVDAATEYCHLQISQH